MLFIKIIDSVMIARINQSFSFKQLNRLQYNLTLIFSAKFSIFDDKVKVFDINVYIKLKMDM